MEEQYWTADKLASEGSFTLACNLILSECTTAFRAGDTATLWKLVDRIDDVTPRVSSEPLVSRLVYTYSLVLLHVGILLASGGDFEYAFLIAHYVEGLREHSAARRVALGLPPLHHTEVRYMLLNLLGDLKCQADESWRDEVLTPAQMWTEWKAAAERAFEHTADMQLTNPERARDVRYAVGWAGVQVVLCCTRYLPAADVAVMIGHFNRRFGQHLAAAAFHFRDNPVLADSEWYWTSEIYKLDFAGRLTLPTLEELWARREQAISRFAKSEDYDLTSFNKAARREFDVLAARATLQLLGGKRAS